MTSRLLRARHGRRATTFAAVTAIVAVGAIGVACGIDVVASKSYPDPPDTAEAAAEASLPPRNDGAFEASDADAGTDAPLACPTAQGAMVASDAGGLFFCIDATEVTNAAYDKFVAATDGGKLDAGPGNPGSPAACVSNATYARGGATGADPADLPAVRVDWCDAYDYCRWAGKHLCAKQVGGDASTGEWYSACSLGGVQRYPYGATFEAGACNENGVGVKTVQSHPACQGSVPGLYDMNGNVSEWVDNCTGSACSAMGGYFFAPASGCKVAYEYARVLADPTVGFRCCADPR